MRLIDADEFKKQIAGMTIVNGYPADKANKMCELIDCQPTAYDMDKVVERLEECRRIMESPVAADCWGEECQSGDCTVCAFDKAIEIVKSGGIE